MNKTAEQFHIKWQANLDDYLRGYAYSPTGKKHKTRYAFLTLEKYFNTFINAALPEDEKMIILPGMRGVGKTTLLSQFYFFEDFIPEKHTQVRLNSQQINYRLYISTDRLVAEKLSLKEYFDFLEEEVFGSLSNNNHKILLLIDEIQYDPDWSLFLKLLFDKTKGSNVLVFVTGSSAIFLNQQSQDLVRRSIFERVLPEKFNEYLLLHKRIYPQKGLSQKLKESIFLSHSADEVFASLNQLRPQIIEKLSRIRNLRQVQSDYFLRGAFPFSAKIETQSLAMERIKNMVLVNIIQKDLILSGDFDSETLVKIPDLLFLLANSDSVSTGKLSEVLSMSTNTVNKVLDALVKAELLVEVRPYGQPYAQVRKSSKFLFISSNIRSGLLNGFIGEEIKGKFLEDYFAFIFEKEFKNRGGIFYDYAKGGADFILRFLDKTEIVFEVGFGKERFDQVEATLSKTSGRAKYGIVIGSSRLEIDRNIVKIPLDYFLLL